MRGPPRLARVDIRRLPAATYRTEDHSRTARHTASRGAPVWLEPRRQRAPFRRSPLRPFLRAVAPQPPPTSDLRRSGRREVALRPESDQRRAIRRAQEFACDLLRLTVASILPSALFSI